MQMIRHTGVVLSAGLAAWAAVGSAFGAEGDHAVFVVVKQIFDCSPKALKGDQTLTLTMDGNGVHGSELSIRRLKGNVWYDLVDFTPADGVKPLMTPEEYASARRVEISATITARRQGPANIIERVFSRPGRYILYSSTNMESEEGGYICTINYVK